MAFRMYRPCQRRDQKTAFAVGVRAGDDAQVGPSNSTQRRSAARCGIPHHSDTEAVAAPQSEAYQSHQHGETVNRCCTSSADQYLRASLAIFLESVATQSRILVSLNLAQDCSYSTIKAPIAQSLVSKLRHYFHSHLYLPGSDGNWQGFFHCQLIAMRPKSLDSNCFSRITVPAES